MKTTKIIIWSVVTLILIAILTNLIVFSKFIPWGINLNRNLTVVYDETISNTDNIENLDIKWTSGDVNIYKSNDDSIKIVQRAYRDLHDAQKIIVNNTNGTLYIKEGKRYVSFGFFIFMTNHTELDLYLPEKEYNDIKIGSTSGDIEIVDLNSKAFDINLTSRKNCCKKIKY